MVAPIKKLTDEEFLSSIGVKMPSAQAPKVSEVSDEEFLKSIGVSAAVASPTPTEEMSDEAFLASIGVSPQMEMPTATAEPTREFTDRPMADDEAAKEGFSSYLYTGLDYLDRLRATVVGSLDAALKGEDISEAASKGISGEEHRLGGDIIYDHLEKAWLEYRAGEDNAWGAFIDLKPDLVLPLMATLGGIATDIILDPLTYTGAGLTKKGVAAIAADAIRREGAEITVENLARKGIKDPKLIDYAMRLGEGPVGLRNTAAARLAEGQSKVKVAGITVPSKVSSAVASTARSLSDAVFQNKAAKEAWQLFSTKHDLPEELAGFIEYENRFKDIISMATVHEVTKTGTPLRKEISALAKELKQYGISRKDIEQVVTEAVERGGVSGVRLGTLPKESIELLAKNKSVRDLVADMTAINKEQLQKEVAAGVPIGEFGTGTRTTIDKLEQAIADAKAADLDTIKNPITGRPKKVVNLEKDLTKLKEKLDAEDKIDYIMHALTPEAKEVLYESGMFKSKKSKAVNPDHASRLARNEVFRDKTIAEINALAREGKLPGYVGHKFENGFFYEDPAVIQTLRGIRHRKSMAAADLLDSTTARFGEDIEKLRVNHKLPKTATEEEVLSAAGLTDYRQLSTARLKELTGGHVFPAQIAERLETHYDKLLDIDYTNVFLKGLDKAQSWWKAFTLGIFPSYHIRNMAGNMWNNFATSERNLLDPREAWKHWNTYALATDVQRGKSGAITTEAGEQISLDQIRDWMDELGVHNRGLVSHEVETAIESQVKGGVWTGNPASLFGLLSKEGKLVAAGHKIGVPAENNARIAKFIEELQLGKDHIAAAEAVKKALFDYGDLTKFETNVMRRVMPFYTWSRKNIPLQVEQMVKHPGRYMAVDHVRREIERLSQDEMDEQEASEYVLNQYMLDNYPMRIKFRDVDDGMGGTRRVPYYFMLGNWLPAADVWKFAADPTKLPLDLLSPFIKTPIELAFKRDLFFDKAIDPEARADFFGSANVNEAQKKILSNIRLLATMDKMAAGLGIYDKSERMLASPESEMTPEEVMVQFVTGLRLYGADLEKQAAFKATELDRKGKEITKLYEKNLTKGMDPDKWEQDVLDRMDEYLLEVDEFFDKTYKDNK